MEASVNGELLRIYDLIRRLQDDVTNLAKEFYETSAVSYDEISGTPETLSSFENDMNYISSEEVDLKIESIPPIDDSNYLKKKDEDSQECTILTHFKDITATTQKKDDCSDNVATTQFVHSLIEESSKSTEKYISGIYSRLDAVSSAQMKEAIKKALKDYYDSVEVDSKIELIISELYIPTKTSDLRNDSGFITIDDIPQSPVTSVNGLTGNVTIQIPTVPTNISSFTNDVGYITDPGVTSVNNQTGTVYVQENVQANWSSTSGLSAILNKPALKRVATTGSYNDLDDTPDIPTKLSLLLNDSDYVKTYKYSTEYVRLGNNNERLIFCGNNTIEIDPNEQGEYSDGAVFIYGSVLVPGALKVQGKDVALQEDIPTNTSELNNDSNFATVSDVQNLVSSLIDNAPAVLDTLNELAAALGDDPSFATTITSQINTKYTKPATGIPVEDLDSDIQASLSKADTALQSFTETDPIFVASAAYGITQTDINNWNAKSNFSGSYSDLSNKPTTLAGYGITDAINTSSTAQTKAGNLTAAKFITSGGTSSQVVRGDGSLVNSRLLPQYEAYLEWGGKNFSASYGPIDAAMVSELGAPRTMFAKAAGIVIEYSTDGGSTWVDYGATDEQKVALFSTGRDFHTGKNTSGSGISTNNMLRVSLYPEAARIYTSLNKFIIYVTTNSSTGCYCTIRLRTQQNYEDNVDTWVTRAEQVPISGWSGYNVINIPTITTYGNTNAKATQCGELQFIFGYTGISSNLYSGLTINKIFGFGGVGWATPSTMAKTGHLYSFDANQNAKFPAQIEAASFKKTGGTSSQFLKADGSVDSNTYLTSYTETDPVFGASAAANITASDISDWNDSKITSDGYLSGRHGAVGIMSSDGSYYALPGQESGVEDDILATVSQVNEKYTKPNSGIPKTDLASAVQTSLGKADTAIQTETDPVFTASVAHGITQTDISNWNSKSDFSGSYNDLTNKPTIPTVPTNVSAFTNDAGYLTGFTESDPTVPAWAKAASKPTYTASEVGALPSNTPLFSGNYNDLTNKPSIPTVPTNVSAFTNDAGYLTSFTESDPTVPSWAKAANKPTYTAAEVGALPDTTVIPSAPGTLNTTATTAQSTDSSEALSGSITLHKVAKTGTYNDLIGKPTIPAAVTESTVSGWGFTKNTGTYSKPSGGIPASDLAAGVIPTIPTNVSTFTNDAGYLTGSDVVTVYSGSTTPSSSLGSNGDIYIQTS